MAVFLVIQAARFGDLVQSKRLVLTLARRGTVHLAVDAALADLARLLYPFAVVHGLALHGTPTASGLEANKKVLATWRTTHFDAVCNCNFSGLTAALCRIFPQERVHGYRWDAGGIVRSPWARTGFLLSRKRCASPLNLVDFWAHFAPEPLPAHAVNPPARRGGQGLGVVLSGREARRSLPAAVLANVVTTAFGALGGTDIRLLGTAAEQPTARRLLRLLPGHVRSRVRDLSGKTDWAGLSHALAGLDALISPDTGSMHLAAHLGVPVLAFFLSSAWCHETGPYGQGHHVWQAAPPCAPCLESAPCPHGTTCLLPFERRELLRSVAAVLAQTLSVPDPGSGLQIWRTGVDALGAAPRLIAGEDAHAPARAQARAFCAQSLRLPPCTQQKSDDPWPVDDTDWMLPPWRYC